MQEIEVFADVWCPFTHVGLRRLVERRSAAGSGPRIRVRSWPLELVNGRPLDVDFVAEEIDQIRETVAPELFAGFDRSTFPSTTLPALALTARAYGRDTATGEAVALELRDLLFEQGRDIGDTDLLASVAAAHDLSLDEAGSDELVRADWSEGQDRGVIGSPHFFTAGGDFFCPALDVRRVDGHLRITADPEGFDRFVESWHTGTSTD